MANKLPNYVGRTPMPPLVEDTAMTDIARINKAIAGAQHMQSLAGAFAGEFSEVIESLQRVRNYAMVQRTRAETAESRAEGYLKDIERLNAAVTANSKQGSVQVGRGPSSKGDRTTEA